MSVSSTVYNGCDSMYSLLEDREKKAITQMAHTYSRKESVSHIVHYFTGVYAEDHTVDKNGSTISKPDNLEFVFDSEEKEGNKANAEFVSDIVPVFSVYNKAVLEEWDENMKVTFRL